MKSKWRITTIRKNSDGVKQKSSLEIDNLQSLKEELLALDFGNYDVDIKRIEEKTSEEILCYVAYADWMPELNYAVAGSINKLVEMVKNRYLSERPDTRIVDVSVFSKDDHGRIYLFVDLKEEKPWNQTWIIFFDFEQQII